MVQKILVADDSKNIQKVVGIIYEDKSFEINECVDVKNLFHKLDEVKPDLVLLDFALDSELSGYELVVKIKSYCECKVILLFGTFDNIDESAITNCGADSYVFKPFDSEKLIQVTDEVLGLEKKSENISEDDEASAWGVQIPGVIGEDVSDENIDFVLSEDDQRIPTIIDEELTKTVVGGVDSLDLRPEDEEEEIIYPSDDDLLYPDMDSLSSDSENSDTSDITKTSTDALPQEIFEEFKVEASSSKLQPADFLKESDEGYESSDSTDIIQTSDLLNEGKSRDIDDLKKEIFDELNEDMWGEQTNVEAVVGNLGKDVISNSSSGVSAGIIKEEILEELKKHIEGSFKSNIHENLKSDLSNNLPEIIKEELLPHFEKHIQEYCRAAVEKGIWEILPDLAEKVITRELEKIRESLDISI